MATYDYTGAPAGAPAPCPEMQGGKIVVFKKRLSATDIIAWNATLTTNAKITAADVFQAIDVAPGFVFQGACVLSVTPEGAAETVDFGIAGSTEIASNYSDNQAAGTGTLMAVAAAWGPTNLTGYFFSAADTIDAKYDSDTTVADLVLYVWGYQLDLTAP
jgi:hypothetical protein